MISYIMYSSGMGMVLYQPRSWEQSFAQWAKILERMRLLIIVIFKHITHLDEEGITAFLCISLPQTQKREFPLKGLPL